MAEAPYLSDPAFRESHHGPQHVDGNGCIHDRDPAPEQIAAMRLAIRRAVPQLPGNVSRKQTEYRSRDALGKQFGISGRTAEAVSRSGKKRYAQMCGPFQGRHPRQAGRSVRRVAWVG